MTLISRSLTLDVAVVSQSISEKLSYSNFET